MMKTKLEILGSYKNYLKAINTKGTDVFMAYEKMYRFIENEVSKVDEDLWILLWASCAENTLNVVTKKGLTFKGGGWSQGLVNDCKWLLELLSECSKLGEQGSGKWKINTHRLYHLFKRATSPNLRLFLISLYRENLEEGYDFLTINSERLEKLLNCSTEEEIDQMLKGTDKKHSEVEIVAPSNAVEILPMEVLTQVCDLYKHFNPKTLKEAAANIVELESLFNEGKLLRQAYDVVLDYLDCRMTYYKNGGKYIEPKTKVFKGVQVIDGEKFIQEDEEEELAAASQSQDSI